MTGSAVQTLADRLGIVAAYTDFHSRTVETGQDTQEALLRAFGFDVTSESEAHEALKAYDAQDDARVVPLCQDLLAGRSFSFKVPRQGDWTLFLESGEAQDLPFGEVLSLPALPVGIHKLTRIADGQTCWLLARPAKAPALQELTGRTKIWGATGAIYALASRRNSGLGDYRDLARAAAALGGHGAAFFGINPVHAIGTASDPGLISPYSPSHRAFVNNWHIALDDLERFGGENVTGSGSKPGALIDYAQNHALRGAALKRAWEVAKDQPLDGVQAFERAGGARLQSFALFEALSEVHGGDWHHWPKAYQAPNSQACQLFAETHAARVAFHIWLQWIAQTQLADAQSAAQRGGMALGLYLDYAVGARPGGAETWMGGASHLQGVSMGAPPDPVSSAGQKWGLAPLSPFGLRKTGYQEFAALLRGVMRQCGMIRIDHVLGFFRAFLIPENGAPGAYVRYPFEEMMAVVMIEAHKAGVLVVGEDLGLVPAGFREALADRGIYGLDIAQFWMSGAQADLPPKEFRPHAIAGFGTHDTPTLAGYVTGADLANLHKLGFLDADQFAAETSKRAPIPADQVTQARDRLHAQLAQGASALVAVQLEDVTVEEMQQNLPGTVNEHPNWQKRHRIAVEDMSTSRDLGSQAALMRRAGRS